MLDGLKVLALIPARGGSKGIKKKNIIDILGKPLIAYTIEAALGSQFIDDAVVTTDSEEIKSVALEYGAQVPFLRPAQLASDEATTLDAVLHAIDALKTQGKEYDILLLLQPTAPLRTGDDIDRALLMFKDKEYRSLLSISEVKDHPVLMREYKADGTMLKLLNSTSTIRRQDMNKVYRVNGCIYINLINDITKQTSFNDNCIGFKMDQSHSVDIDEYSDIALAEYYLKINNIDAQFEKIAPIKTEKFVLPTSAKPEIKMLLTDCDGCLTDAGMYYSETGDELKKFNARDGVAFSLLRKHGIVTGIITGEDRQLNLRRVQKLKIDLIEGGCQDKASAVKRICQQYKIDLKNVAFVGDEINDLEALKLVGFSCCPADAAAEVKQTVNYIATAKGGEGVIREVARLIL